MNARAHVRLVRRLSDGVLYDCAMCDRQPALKEQLGHDAPPIGFYRENLITGEPLAECPLRSLLRARDEKPSLTRELDRYVEHYRPAYDAGMLLDSGGIGNQPARYLALIRALEDADAASQRKYDEITKTDDDTGENA